MYQTILVAYDDSDPARAGASLGARLAARLEAKLVITNVIEPSGDDPEAATLQSELSETTRGKCDDAEAMLVQAAERARSAVTEAWGTPGRLAPEPETRVAIGEEGARLVEVIEEESADLVVAGTHGVGHAKQVLLGSVSQNLLNTAHSDLLYVRDGEVSDRVPAIMVGWDGSEGALSAAEKGLGLARALGSELIISHVEPYEAPFSDSPFLSKRSRDEVREELHHRSEQMVEQLREELGIAVDEATWEVREGHVREQMIAIADEHAPSIAVVGTRGASGVKGLIAGSVTRDLLDHSRSPVLVVRLSD